MFYMLYVRMYYILVLCPVLLASQVLTLTIDSQLGTSVEDCFERVSIGEQLPRDIIYRNVTELTTIECETICKQDKQCQSYDYGVGAKGNATCDLSKTDEKEIKEKNLFQKNPDYDVYVRRFNCEQSPPTPIEQAFETDKNENSDKGPTHKPIVRPTEDDSKRPLADDLPYENRPQASYASNRPYRPGYNQFNDRPDDYNAMRPDNDRPPSYGDHRPQEIPYRPERPYRNVTRPDPYDQLYFQDPYKRPRPGSSRPDPYHPPQVGDEIQDIYGSKPGRPQRPEYVTEKPQYQYIIRPNRKPKPEDQGYNRPNPDPYGPGGHNDPIRPPSRPYKPTRPYEKPSYTYTDQYASNYGTSQDNSIYVEIYDPPRPYRPSVEERPYYGASSSGLNYGQNYGYNSYSNQNSYAQSQQQYGSSSYYGGQRPQRPTYGGSTSLNDDNGYGSRPPYKPKPSYDSYHHSVSSQNQASYGESYASNQQYYNQGTSGYGTQVSNTYGGSQYENSQNVYANQLSGSQNRPPNQYGQDGYKEPPSNNYGGSNSQYGSNQSDNNQYSNSQNGYGSQATGGYGGQSNNYGINQEYNSNTQSGYGNQATGNYGNQATGSYGNQATGSYGNQNTGGYGNQATGSYGGQSNQYGSNQDSQNSKYPSSQSGYGNEASNSYGGQSNKYGSTQDSQNSKYPSSQSGYGNEATGGYGGQSNQYGSSQESQKNKYPSSQSGYGNEASSSYGGQSNQYGSTQVSHNNEYTSSQSGYGSQTSNSYGGQSNQYGSVQESNKYPSSQSGYGSQTSSSYGGQSNQYGSVQESNKYPTSQSGYGNEATGGYGGQSNQYGSTQESHKNKYPNSESGYGNQVTSGYGEQVNQQYGSQNYQNNKVTDTQSGYGSQTSSLGSQSNQYGNNNVGYGNQGSNAYNKNQSSYQYGSQGNQYDSQSSQASNYAGSQLNLDYSNYHGSHLGYGIHHLYGIKPGSYENDSPNNRPLITSTDRYDKPKPNRQNNRYQDKPLQDPIPSQSGYKPDKDPGYKKPGTIPGYDIDKQDVKPVYEQGMGKPSGPNYLLRPNGDIVTSKPVAVAQLGRDPGNDVSYEACFRRVLAGRRALRSHVRRVVDCERLEDCRRECATERRFHCESFNYRLDPSFRGKGLCELMTKPIEAFDIRQDFVEDKDYDFYELDRNSLEPYCPDTLRGPGLLHSGYLSSKPAQLPGHQDQWRDRMDWEQGYKSYNRFYDEKRTQSYNRRYEDQFYVPYQIGVSKTYDDRDSYGQYGGSYGGYDSYYKDRKDYHNSVNHWRLSDEKKYNQYHGVRHHNDEKDFDYYSLRKDSSFEDYGYGYGSWKKGRWNSSGSFWKDERETHDRESYHNHDHKSFYFESEGRSDETTTKDCSSRRRPGMSLGSGAIRRSLHAHNVVECEAACFNEREFKCVSYSYRYSSGPGSDNCFLSERPYLGLEMSADSDSDVYAMPLHQDCLTISTKPWVESECFWHVRSGSAVTDKAVRASLTVTGLGACEAECIRAHSFFCRGFSFRFDAPTIGDDLENCLLTSSPPTSLDLGQSLRPSKHELYARGNYGRGCEPALYDDVNREPQCYLQYEKSAKLLTSAIRGTAHAIDERACGRACSDAPFRCLSFSYSTNSPPDSENCLLSEIRMFDLQRGVDYSHSSDDLLFAFDLFNGQCWRKVHGKQEYDIPTLEVPHPIEGYPVSASGPDLPPLRPETYISSSGPSGPDYPDPPKPYVPATGSGYKPDFEVSGPPKPYLHNNFKPDYVPESGPGISGPSGPPSGPSIPIPPSGPSGPSGPTGPSGPPIKPSYEVIEPGLDPSYLRPYRPIPKPDRRPGYLSDPGYRPPYGSSGQDFGFRPPRPTKPYIPVNEVDEPLTMSWRHYTVSGFPCRKGTSCEQNLIAGHWACEPEAGEIGSWDYCCAPSHRCGYSEGFKKPWCYVGPAQDQWRPCSEKYYPYHQHKGPHPSQGHSRDAVNSRPDRPTNQLPDRDRLLPKPNYNTQERHRNYKPYLPEADRRYWDDLYKNGPQAYYDKYGNPLPGFTRVPTEERPHIKYHHNPPRPGSGYWVAVNARDEEDIGGELGIPRYWPVAYLHKGPPPNMTYFRYNETKSEKQTTPLPRNRQDFKRIDLEKPVSNALESRIIDDRPRSEKRINITDDDDILDVNLDFTTTTKPEPNETKIENEAVTEYEEIVNKTQLYTKPKKAKVEDDYIKGIDGKLHDFTRSLEIFDIDDVKGDKITDTKTLEAEEKQIEAIGRILASRRNGKLIIEKRSQKDIESKNIALDKDFVSFDFGNRFPTPERRGVVRKVSKDDIEKEKLLNDKSLEVSETTFVRPPRVLSTTESVKKAVVNGKVFYDATIKDHRELYSNATRRGKNLRLDENRAPLLPNGSPKKKNIRTRNTNPIRRVRRVYRKKYNPEEVRKRLLEREKNKNGTDNIKS